MTKKRTGRFQRPAPVSFQKENPNKLDILGALIEHGRLRTSRFYDLFPERSRARLRSDLREMYRAKLIDRDQEDKSNWAQELEYTARKEGEDVYYQHRPDPNRVFVENDELRRLNTHNRMIIDLLANIKGNAGLRFAPESVIVPDKLRFKVDISHTFPSGKTETYNKHIYPDGAFAIAYPDKPRNYVLELENTSVKSRTTLQTSSYFRKLLCYKYVYEKELYKELGWDNMRVLVGAPTMELLLGKMKLQAELIGPKTVFLYQVIPLNGKLGDMFTTPWYRVGHPPISLDTNKETKNGTS